jgi:hypothetical protein
MILLSKVLDLSPREDAPHVGNTSLCSSRICVDIANYLSRVSETGRDILEGCLVEAGFLQGSLEPLLSTWIMFEYSTIYKDDDYSIPSLLS